MSDLIKKLESCGLYISGGAFLSIASNDAVKDIDLISFDIPKEFIYADYTLKHSWKNGYSGWIGKYNQLSLQYLGINSHLKFDITSAQGIIRPDLSISYCPKPELIEKNIISKKSSDNRLKKYLSRWNSIMERNADLSDLSGVSLYNIN